jgi:hypothetical protein
MSNGKQNSRNGWAEGFLSWEKNNSHPERNDLLWEKLNQKLQVPRKKKRMNLLWAAASFFMITGSFIFWNYRSKTGQEISSGFKKHSYVLPYAPFHNTKETGITIVNQPVKQEINIKKPNDLSIDDPAPSDNDLIKKTVQPVVTDSPQIATNNPVTQQKKIRVVHMNEWFSSPPPTFATSKDEDMPYTPSIWPGKHRGLSPPSSNN